MSTITVNSTMSIERTKRKHTKDGMARLLHDIYDLMQVLGKDGTLREEHKRRLDELATRIVWG